MKNEFDQFMDYVATAEEGLISGDQKQKWALQKSPESMEAKSLRQSAKDLANRGNYQEAIGCLNKAMANYKLIKREAYKIPDKNTMAGTKFADGSSTYKGIAKSSLLRWVNSQISDCQGTIAQYKNKMSLPRK